MDVLLSTKTDIGTGDAVLGPAMCRDITAISPTVRKHKAPEPEEANSDVSPVIMEHPASAANTVPNGAKPGSKMTSIPVEESIQYNPETSDAHNESTSEHMIMPLPEVGRCDETVCTDASHRGVPSDRDFSATKNNAPSDKNESNLSTMQTDKSNFILVTVTLNVTGTVSEGSIDQVESELQNGSEVSAVGNEENENATNATGEDEALKSQSLSSPSSTGTGTHVQSEDRDFNSLESVPRRLGPEIKNTDAIQGSEDPIVDSRYSETEENYYNFDANNTNSALPEYFNVLSEGMNICGDSRCSIGKKPEWFDMDKFRKGQRIAMKYLFGLVLAEMLSLMMIFSHPASLQPLIFTGKSNTPFKSFKRYLSTVVRIRSWYSDDIWEPGTDGHNNIKVVRTMHETVRQEMHRTELEEFRKRSTLSGNCKFVCNEAAIWSPLHEQIREDFQRSCSYPSPEQRPFLTSKSKPVFVNQTDMALTQFGFVGLFVLFPGKFGAHSVSDDDMDSFVYLWRCVGYVLGLEDRYNFCNGDLKTVRQRSRDLIRFWVKPNLRVVSRDWEHMTRCIVEGINYYIPGITFEASLLYLCGILGIYAPRIAAALTFRQKLLYHLMTLTLCVLMRLPGAPIFFNWLMNLAIRIAQMASPEKLKKFEQRKYPYEENATCTQL
jgi:hypothetical protein